MWAACGLTSSIIRGGECHETIRFSGLNVLRLVYHRITNLHSPDVFVILSIKRRSIPKLGGAGMDFLLLS